MDENFRLDRGKRKAMDEELVALYRLLRRMEASDAPLALHSMRVAALAVELAAFAGVSEWEMRRVYFGALLHDVGKLAIAGEILKKPGRLTQSEYLEIQRHPVIGARMIADDPNLYLYEDIVRHHHERPDGTGYPKRLAGAAIPLATRIITACDIFDAITAARPYRAAMPLERAFELMERERDTAIDGRCLEALKRTAAAAESPAP